MRSTYDIKDNMWLGVSLDVQHHPTQKDIITCAHLRKNELTATNGHRYHLANGACYVINSELNSSSVKTLMPLPHRSKEALDPLRLDYNAVAQVGASATYSEECCEERVVPPASQFP
ncbi:uncharacterized protein LOC129219093 [Uloborus diversus]|uniref:uncharacterized protein LOC129219093 n=1 Tax=Uloborus diversus TaxID=327109 RepID=UPI0024096B0A|nr:uncharacterized protein LOC129219093 [Uloborus diversus]